MEKVTTYGAWVVSRWRPLITGLTMILLMGGLLAFHLTTLTKGATIPEVTYLQNLHSGKNLLSDPTFLIHKFPSYLLYKLGFHTIFAYRMVSVIFAGVTIISGFVMLKRAYSTRVGVLGAGLLTTSAWVLHIGRSAAPEASFLLLLPLLLVAAWLHSTTRHYHSLLTLSLITVMCFYIPGFWWLALAVIIWECKAIWAALRAVPWWFRVICGTIAVLGLIPLLWGAIHNLHILLAISGLPPRLADLRLFGKHLVQIPVNLVAFGPNDPSRWLGRIPILDIFSTSMLIVGVYSLRYHLKEHTVRFVVASSIIVILLIATGGLTTITALIPLLYIFISAGIAFMLQQWTTVFPRNPIARTLATSLMSVTVLLVSYYHINHYFIAWPQTPATKHAFGQSLIK